MVDKNARERGPEQTCEGGAMKRHRRHGVRPGWRSIERGLVANRGKGPKSSMSALASRAGKISSWEEGIGTPQDSCLVSGSSEKLGPYL